MSQSEREQDMEWENLPYGESFYWLQTMVVTIVLILLASTFLCRITRVVGQSMDNTLSEGELLFVQTVGYHPQAGDVVIVNKTTAAAEQLLRGEAIVKRVIATGGQTVDINYETGSLYVDGELREEPYIKEQMTWPRDSEMWETHFEIPEGCVFVLGDNRNNSTDSRKPTVGAVDERFVLGGARIVLFPPTRWKLLG